MKKVEFEWNPYPQELRKYPKEKPYKEVQDV